MRILRKITSLFLIWGMAITLLFAHPDIAKAETATVTFGSESYSAQSNGEFMVGVYLNAESRIGTYHVEIEYDANRLEYTGGAESGGDGLIILEGTGLRSQIKYMLSFRCLSGGEAYLGVNGAQINISSTDNVESFEITELDTATVVISGEDTVGETTPPPVEPEIGFDTTLPHIDELIYMNSIEHYLLDVTQMMPGDVLWDYEMVVMPFLEKEVTFLTNVERSVYLAYLFDQTETLVCYAYNPEQNMFYPCQTYQIGDKTYLYTSPDACSTWTEELTRDAVTEQNIVFAIDSNGHGAFCRVDIEGNMVEWDKDSAKQSHDIQTYKLVVILVIAVVVITLILVFAYIANREKKRKERIRAREAKRREERSARRKQQRVEAESLEIADLSQATQHLPVIDVDVVKEAVAEKNAIEKAAGKVKADKKEKIEEKPKRKPVISVRDVTMRFKIATSNVSGIKEYVIQLLKKQISYRELLALDHVSFDVYKGEVVGIIGTNGSGKSTLLRIVSGALAPNEGEVIVNRKKLQLLTLGTGFDMELTARENVYLNGAIIGYTEEFINQHYDEIVAFAELEGFMEEKVKNFSSGMVSRLGFAIATVGEASEILILDEVLSVGDEFFRKKSLARIKEMIHGGSTVLMVSHGMGTIQANCSKVVWIEKGKLMMVGPAKEVCEAYQRQFEEPKKLDKTNLDKEATENVKNGLKLENGIWYLYKNGKIDRETSLASNAYGWWYIKDGQVDFSYTGLAQNQYGYWYVEKGKLNFAYSGNIEWKGKTYLVQKGKVTEQK